MNGQMGSGSFFRSLPESGASGLRTKTASMQQADQGYPPRQAVGTGAMQMRGLVIVLLVLLTGPAPAHKLATQSTPDERRLAGITSGTWLAAERTLAQWSLEVFTET